MNSRKLLQQYAVMAWTRIESQKLRYFRQHQSTLRSEKYCTLQRNVTPQTESGKVHGKRVVLPHTHTASPRWFKRKNYEALAIARAKGKPHLFITMTCNPNHPHILAAIDENMEPSDLPDIIARIFRQPVQELINMLYNGDVPGWEKVLEKFT